MITSLRQNLIPKILILYNIILPIHGANWAQLAGERAQNTATPYLPDNWHRDVFSSVRPMWSARWGHALVVLNQSEYRDYLSDEENSRRARSSNPVLVLLGGDDGFAKSTKMKPVMEMGIGSGKLRNDVWIGRLNLKSQANWRVDDRYLGKEGSFNHNLIRSEMTWYNRNPGRISPPVWPSGRFNSQPMTNEDWIACQDSIKHNLIDPSICNDPPMFCYDNIQIPGCIAQAVWKKDNMWAPRRGLGAAVANGKIYVIGGLARDYARIDDLRLIGGIWGHRRVETVRDHSTIREDQRLKNDVWSSEDEGLTWKLVNPGCKDHQQDVLMQTELWSRNVSDVTSRRNVGSIGAKCFLKSDCYGVAECKALGNSHEKVCVCPLFSPRQRHTVTVQHRFSINDDGSIYEQDVLYVIGGFTSIKQGFCADRSCGPADGYKLAMDDAWMSSDGLNWIQIKPALSNHSAFIGRGSHTALIVPAPIGSEINIDDKDVLLIFGGETSHPQVIHTHYLNDVWQVSLPKEPCCTPSRGCVEKSKCLPSQSEWKVITLNAEWSQRSGHVSVYEPPSSSNSFRPRIYLIGGKNISTSFADVWTWTINVNEKWRCDFFSDPVSNGESLKLQSDPYLSGHSSLSHLKKFELPSLDGNGNLNNSTALLDTPLVSELDLSIMESLNISTINDLANADLYTILKLRGFDFPGKISHQVKNICILRAVSVAFTGKCSLEEHLSPTLQRLEHPFDNLPKTLCGSAEGYIPCKAADWDGCSPIDGVSKINVYGLGNVNVPQVNHDVSEVVGNLFCRQVPGNRYLGAAAFVDNKVVVLGGVADELGLLYRDVWYRDESFPHTFIALKPDNGSPQFKLLFDSNQPGAHVFEYKIIHNNRQLIPWKTTTKLLGVDVSWLDDKVGGPGKGWYTLYVRAIDPSGNRDNLFSTKTNVYRWYYVPPIPWGALTGGVITSLVLIAAGYYDYRRRKKRDTLKKFILRRLRRKFKLKTTSQEMQNEMLKCSHSTSKDFSSLRIQRISDLPERNNLFRRHFD